MTIKKVLRWILSISLVIIGLVIMVFMGSAIKVLAASYPLIILLIIVIVVVLICINRKGKADDQGLDNDNQPSQEIDLACDVEDVNREVASAEQGIELCANIEDKPKDVLPRKSTGNGRKTAIITLTVIGLVWAVIIVSIYSFLGRGQNTITNDLFEISVPSDWDVEESNVEGIGCAVQISCDDEMLILFCVYEVMDIETAMEYSQKLPYSELEELRNASYGEAYDAKVNNYPARHRTIDSFVGNNHFAGRLSVVATRSSTMFLVCYYDVGIVPNASEILKTLRFIEIPTSPKSVATRMKAQVKNLASKMPQQIDEYTIQLGLEVIDSTLVHTYKITEDLGLDEQELELFCLEAKSEECQRLRKINNSLVVDWLNVGYFIRYILYDNHDNELFQYTISKDDLQEIPNY